MKLHLVVLAVLAGVSLAGCGEPVVVEAAEPLEEVSQALCNVSAACPGGFTVSCSGTQCSGQDGSHVTCDGNTTPCPPQGCTASTTCTNGSVISCQDPNGSCYVQPQVYIYCGGTNTVWCPCSGTSCSYLNGRSCSSGSERACCWSPSETGACYCTSRGTWSCGAY